jgi:hypothetical protein
VLVASILQGDGFDTLTARDAGMLGRSDEEHLQFATDAERTVLTHNRRDFERLARRWFDAGRSHNGIIIAYRRELTELIRRLDPILNGLTADEIRDRVVYI